MIFSIKFLQVCEKKKAGAEVHNFGSVSRRLYNFGSSAPALQHCRKPINSMYLQRYVFFIYSIVSWSLGKWASINCGWRLHLMMRGPIMLGKGFTQRLHSSPEIFSVMWCLSFLVAMRLRSLSILCTTYSSMKPEPRDVVLRNIKI
jgi:hypothetical protein